MTQNISHSDFQFLFLTFTFQICLYSHKMHVVHIICLLRVDGSILAGVFLTSSFCVVPESSYSSNAASSSLLVACTQTALVQLVAPRQQCMASFKHFRTKGGGHRNWWLFSSTDSYAMVSNRFRLQLQTVPVMMGCYDSILCGDSLWRVSW